MTITITPFRAITMLPLGDYTAALTELVQGRDEWPLAEVLRRDDIPVADRIWLALQPGVLPDAMRVAVTEVVVARAVRTHALSHPATHDWAERWLSGVDRSAKAANAANVKAYAASWEASWEATAYRAAAWAAANAADAAAAAARAARAAAMRAAMRASSDEDAERQHQLNDILAALEAA